MLKLSCPEPVIARSPALRGVAISPIIYSLFAYNLT